MIIFISMDLIIWIIQLTMKAFHSIATFVFFSWITISISCKKEAPCDRGVNTNKSPIANAGSDQVIIMPTDSVLLDGNASSDPDGIISSYLGTKISGPASFNIKSTTGIKTVIKNLFPGQIPIN